MSHRPGRTALIALVVVALAAACGGDDANAGSDEQGRSTSGGDPIGPANEGIEGVEAFDVASNTHTQDDLTYDHTPPVGGDHFPIPATCGFYSADAPDDVPPDEMLVHSIEHGAIWIAHRPDLDDAAVSTMRDLAGSQAKVIVTPHDDLDSPLMVTAWARQLPLDSPDDPRLMPFITRYRSDGEAPEATSTCQGAGTPDVVSPAA